MVKMNKTEKTEFRRELMTLAVPFALQYLLTALVGASDALMLGRLTQESIAAVSLANQISFVMSLFTGAAVGAIAVLISQYWGKGEYGNVRRFFGMAIRYTFGISLVFFLLTLLIPEKLMGIFTPETELIRIGAGYLRIVGFSYLFNALSQAFLMVMKIAGYAKLSVIISAVTVSVDMIADFFLIYGFGSFQGLGANGSAYSTVVVECISLIWCVVWMLRKQEVRLKITDLTGFSKEFEKDIWKIIPGMLASSLAWGLSISMHSFIIGHLGTDATAAYSVTGVAQELIQCVAHGFAGGAGVMIGQLLGRNELQKAKAYGDRFWLVAILSGLANIALIAVVGPLVYHFYVLEPLAKSYLVQMLIMSAFYMFAYAFNTIITCGVFPAGGDSMYDAVSVILATWCFAIPLALLGCFLFHWPVMVVYVVMCLDEIVKVPFILPRYKKGIWLKNLTREELSAAGSEDI